MNNKCSAKFMADMEPLIEVLLRCEEAAQVQDKAKAIFSVSEDKAEFEKIRKLTGRKLPKPYTQCISDKAKDNMADAAQECALNLKHTEHLTMACPVCGENLIGRWNRVLAALTAYCKKCNRIKYKANTEDESWEPVDYPWYETEKK